MPLECDFLVDKILSHGLVLITQHAGRMRVTLDASRTTRVTLVGVLYVIADRNPTRIIILDRSIAALIRIAQSVGQAGVILENLTRRAPSDQADLAETADSLEAKDTGARGLPAQIPR
jgi:hypothetical protein